MAVAQTEVTKGDSAVWNDKVSAGVAIYWPEFTTEVRIDSTTLGVGTEISLEDDLEFEDRVAMLTGGVSVGLTRSFSIDATYLDLSRDSTNTITGDLQIGDEIFEAGASLNSSFDVTMLRVAGVWKFIQQDTFYVAGTFGAHLVDASVGFTGTVGVGDESATASVTADSPTVLPLPNVGLKGGWHLGKGFFLTGQIDWFELGVEDYSGGLVSGDFGVNYRFTNWGSVGVGYHYFDFTFEYDDSEWRGSLEYGFNGPYVGFRVHL